MITEYNLLCNQNFTFSLYGKNNKLEKENVLYVWFSIGKFSQLSCYARACPATVAAAIKKKSANSVQCDSYICCTGMRMKEHEANTKMHCAILTDRGLLKPFSLLGFFLVLDLIDRVKYGFYMGKGIWTAKIPTTEIMRRKTLQAERQIRTKHWQLNTKRGVHGYWPILFVYRDLVSCSPIISACHLSDTTVLNFAYSFWSSSVSCSILIVGEASKQMKRKKRERGRGREKEREKKIERDFLYQYTGKQTECSYWVQVEGGGRGASVSKPSTYLDTFRIFRVKWADVKGICCIYLPSGWD